MTSAMSMISSLRSALRPAYRRLRVLLGVQPPSRKKEKSPARKGKGKKAAAAPAALPKRAPAVVAPAAVAVATAAPRAAGSAQAGRRKAAAVASGARKSTPSKARKAARPDAGKSLSSDARKAAAASGSAKLLSPEAGNPGTPARAAKKSARRRWVRPEGKPWNILFLGGSNTVMKNGYSDAMIACLADSRGPVGRVVNLAAGGNSTIHGLMLAKERQDLADFDVVVIEYGVNDVKLAGLGAIEIWKAATEGLLRHLLTIRPDVHVVFVLFGRQEMRKSYMYRPADLTLTIAGAYSAERQVTVVDIDHLLRDVLFPDATEFAQLFSDGSHYRRPQIARLVGALVASRVTGAPRRDGRELPEPVFPGHFAESELVDLVPDPALADRVFANSRYNIPTRRIGLGETVTLDLPGPIAGIEFVSLPTGATLRVSEEGETPFALHTRHSRTQSARFPFLLRCQALEHRPWPTLARGPRRVTLEALPTAPADEVKKALNMVAAGPGAAEGVYLTRLLCIP